MSTELKIEEAMKRSVTHNEIVRVDVDDIRAGLDEVELISDECDSATENDGSIDAWGVLDGSDFRIRISQSVEGGAR